MYQEPTGDLQTSASAEALIPADAQESPVPDPSSEPREVFGAPLKRMFIQLGFVTIARAGAEVTRTLPGTGTFEVDEARSANPDSEGGLYVGLVKPAFDRTVALILLLVLTPLMLVVAAAILLTSGPGAIFRQVRIGHRGRPFMMHKFRTMSGDRRQPRLQYDGEERRRTHKHPNDPRVTRLGNFLRKWSLDELPQLWDVFRGDMSMVGPRPELPGIAAAYEPWQHQRHRVKPGVTGLWQVTKRGNGLMHEHVAVDISYISRIGLLTDLGILLLTIPAVLGLRTGY
jgi:lipopolysaccharide/colanic/teichoic acid biosynthesis glycosyltransferase